MSGSSGSSTEGVMDAFSGMLTRKQANRIAKGDFGNIETMARAGKTAVSAKELSLLTVDEWDWLREKGGVRRINISDTIYRIFNPYLYGMGVRELEKRKIIVGESDSTVAITLPGELSTAVDSLPLQRGDTISAKNLLLQSHLELEATQSSSIKRLKCDKAPAISDYPSVSGEIKNTDIIGIVVELGPMRRVTRGSIIEVTSECKLSDTKEVAHVNFRGSAALATAKMKLNSWVKIEFCNVRRSEGIVIVNANDSSRVFSSETLMPQKAKTLHFHKG